MAWKHRYCNHCGKVTLWWFDDKDKNDKYCSVCFNG